MTTTSSVFLPTSNSALQSRRKLATRFPKNHVDKFPRNPATRFPRKPVVLHGNDAMYDDALYTGSAGFDQDVIKPMMIRFNARELKDTDVKTKYPKLE